MQLMQNFLLRLNVFPPFNGLMERRLAIYTTRTPVETFTSPCVGLIIISLFISAVNSTKTSLDQHSYLLYCLHRFMQCMTYIIYLFFIMSGRNSQSNSAFINRYCRRTNSGAYNASLVKIIRYCKCIFITSD